MRGSGTSRRLGLRARTALWFAGIALALASIFGVATFLVVRGLLLAQSEDGALEQVIADARLVARTIGADAADEAHLLSSLRPPVRSRPFLLSDGQWFSASLQVRTADLPSGFVDLVLDGVPARQRFSIQGTPYLAVGLPLEPGESLYLEVFSLETLQATLTTLGTTLVVAGSSVTMAGATLGWLASWKVLRPLREVTGVAEEIAEGKLSSRLDEGLDPDLRRLSASFNSMADSLESRIAREARFASDVSHELRSPLTTLMTTLSVLEHRRHELSPQAREALDLLSSDVRRFHRMVLDLIEISQHDSGRIHVELEHVQATEVARSVLKRLGFPADRLETDPEVLGSVVLVDQRRVERVLANLLDNADVHGGGVARVTLTRTGRWVEIGVEDAGPGIREAERERVLERFARGADGRRGNRDGAGLGLALAEENARLNRGALVLSDSPMGGARVALRLPVTTS